MILWCFVSVFKLFFNEKSKCLIFFSQTLYLDKKKLNATKQVDVVVGGVHGR